MTDLEIANGLPEIPEKDWREAIIRRRLKEGFVPVGFMIEPDVHTARTDKTWGETHEYEGHMHYPNNGEYLLAETNRATIAWMTQSYGPENVVTELVPLVFEKHVKEYHPSTYPLRNYRMIMVRRPENTEAQAA